jgi:hypothetical protein
MTRWKAAAIHLSLSCVIGITAFCLLYFVYYPQPYFAPAGADELVFILLGVDVALGPLLTLAVFKLGKWGMKFDLAAIALLQLAALSYGGYVMWVARPVFIVAAVDRINLVYANSIAPDDLAAAEHPQFRKFPLFGPIRVDLRPARPGKEQIDLMDVMDGAKDKELLPKYYVEWTAETESQLLKRSAKIGELSLDSQRKIRATLNPLDTDVQVLPLIGRTENYSYLVRQNQFTSASAVLASPWR